MLRFNSLFANSQRNFYLVLSLCLVAMLFTYPFLIYPYDMYHHITYIDVYQDHSEMPKGRWIWHYLWGKFFYYISIPKSEIFFRAYIVHIIQSNIAFFSVYLFSNVIIRNLYKDIDKTILSYLSLWSVIIWFSIFATFSMNHQVVWNLWYSVNYQVTLPLFWYITALTLTLFLETTTIYKKIFFTLQILVISRFILQAHSMEYVYYLMHISIFCIVYVDKIFSYIKKYYYIAIPMIVLIITAIVYFAKNYQPEKSKIFNYLDIDKLPLLYENILLQGEMLVSGANRAGASINELMIVILYTGIAITLVIFRNRLFKVAKFLDIRLYIYLIVTSLFVLIPLYVFSGGLFGIVTNVGVVNRLYYSSSLYLLLPVFIYYIWYLKDRDNLSVLKINLSLFLILISVWGYSKYYTQHKIYATNVKSIQNSFFKQRNAFNLSKQQIDTIAIEIEKYEINNKTKKKNYYYARPDIAFVIKFIYAKDVLWVSRYMKTNKYTNYTKIYTKAKKRKSKYNLVLFKTPKGFPKYVPFK